ncbi:MAG: PAS domain S-box protein [Planctomycetales bacterium]
MSFNHESNMLPDDRFRQVVEASPAGVLIVDGEGRIQLVNNRIETWFGYARSELTGRHVEMLVPDSIRPVHVELRNQYLKTPEVRQLGSGRDLTGRRKDGTEFPCDISLHPLRTQDDIQIMVHVVDTTERRRLEAERRQQEFNRRLRFMVDNLPAGAVSVTGDTIKVNRATEEITGYQREELQTLEVWFSKLFGDRAGEVQAAHLRDRAENFPKTELWEIIRSDGQKRWVERRAFRDEHDEVWLLYDVTDRMRAQQQVVQAERLAAIGEMMTALAHESRNALQRAQACLEMMELDLEDRPELLNLARRSQAAVDELQRLYEEVSGYASPLALDRQETDLPSLSAQVWSNLKTARGEKVIAFRQKFFQDFSKITVDPHRFGQVLRNIFENSISVLPSIGGEMCVSSSVEEKDGQVRLKVAVRDNGPGLSGEQKVRIFEPFYTTKSRGTGLGMPIARRIMQAHGGDIAIGEVAAGTEILLFLPLSSSQGTGGSR